MARASSSGKGGSSRIRFIMLEADLSEGDLSEVTTAIQNALRPQQTMTRVVHLPAGSAAEQGLITDGDEETLDEVSFDQSSDSSPRRSRSSSGQKRTFPTPKVVDVDWDVVPTVQDYMKAHPPRTVADKFLAAVGWFKQAGGKDSASTDEVYTLFRKMGWPTNIKDFSQPLRDLKGQQVLTGGAKTGFSINHIGLDRIEKFADGQ